MYAGKIVGYVVRNGNLGTFARYSDMMTLRKAESRAEIVRSQYVGRNQRERVGTLPVYAQGPLRADGRF